RRRARCFSHHSSILLCDQHILIHQVCETRVIKRMQRVCQIVHHRFSVQVEAGVQKRRNTCDVGERFDQVVVIRCGRTSHYLWPYGRVVCVYSGSDVISECRRRRRSEFVWKNGGKSVGRASRVPPYGFEKADSFCIGAPDRTRTCDLQLKRLLLYQLSYWGKRGLQSLFF
ncbi:MAG: hypothetical protein XD85_0407, partial [Parcubacteria bacterium 34_609]